MPYTRHVRHEDTDPCAPAPSERREVAARRKAIPLWAMLDRLGFDVVDLQQSDAEHHLDLMKETCAACENVADCRHWMCGRGRKEEYRRFCANAPMFDTLPRRPVAR